MPVAQTRLEILQVHKFLQCVRNQDQAQMEKLCAHGVPHLINYSEPAEGETGLHLAARANDEATLRFLLELGAHPNVVDLRGRTAAMRAAEYGHVQSLEVLATAGSDMKIKDADGKGILFYCILPTSRHAKCTQIVLECGAECNNMANDGMPLLVLSCVESVENEKICIQFLDQGADANSCHPTSKKTPLMEAACSGSVAVVRAVLAKGGDVNAKDKNQRTAAHLAAQNGHFEVLRLLSSYGADLSLVDVIGNTMIHYTAEGGFANCLKFLAQRGCKAHTKNDDGLLPKVIAKSKGFKDVMKESRKAERLTKKLQGGGKAPTEAWAVKVYDWAHERQAKLLAQFQGVDPDGNEVLSKDDFYDILVNLAAPIDEEHFKALFLLHDKTKEGVINYHDFLAGKKYVHKTYLMSAFEKKEKKKKGKKGKKKKGKTKVPMPICVGVEGSRTEYGEPPRHLIHRHVPFTDTGRFDRDHPPSHPIQDDSAWYLRFPEKTYINITDATKMTDLDSLRQAYSHGRSVNAQDKYYKTSLMVSCAHGNLEMTRFLLENGADVNCQDNFRWTPLHHACLSGQLDVVQLLVQYQANLNVQAMNGGTPLMRAIQTSAPEIVRFLIEKGCDVTLENRKGDNALDVAKWWADPRVLEIVQAKFESMPQPKEGKKGKGKGKKGRGKSGQKQSPARAHSVPPLPQGGMTTQMPDSPTVSPRDRKGSVLRAASAMAGGIEHTEDITYVPLVAWSNVPNTRELIVKKEQRRMRFGDGVDFPDFRMPFRDNFMKTSEALGGVDSDDDD